MSKKKRLKSAFDYETRGLLEELLQQGYNISELTEMLNICRPAINNELKEALTEEEFKNKRYVLYRRENAIKNILEAVKRELYEGSEE